MKLVSYFSFTVFLTVFLGGCNSQDTKAEDVKSPFELENCVNVGHQVKRCENVEVVCYLFDGYKEGGISCLPKK